MHSRSNSLKLAGAFLIMVPATQACKSSSDQPATSTLRDSKTHQAELYDATGSTENELWNGDCKTAANAAGFRQSPIAINSASFPELEAANGVTFNLGDTAAADVVDNGHTIKVNFPQSPGSLTAGNEVFDLKQFHFHAQSEHTLDGKYAPLETHFVFMNQAGNKAVAVGFMSWPDAAVTPGHLRPVETLLAAQAAEKPEHGHEKALGKNLALDLKTYFGSLNGEFYTYEGSLTTPPCSQIVTHMVYKKPMPVSAGFLNSFKKFYSNNYRRLQAQGEGAVRNLRLMQAK